MNGVKYYRIKKGLKQKELCRMADITLFTLVRMEHADRDSVGKLLAEHYRRVRIVLDAPVDELLREDLPEVEEGTHVRNMRPSGSECPENCLAVYRQAHHLTLRDVAAMLGVSHESVRLACREKQAPAAYIARLAALEHLSEAEFRAKYRKEAP